MVSVKDVLALLDKWPQWKAITGLPARVDKLEARVKDLEDQLSGGVGDRCPSCGKPSFMVESSKPDDVFGEGGAIRRMYKCSQCGYEEERMIA